MHKVRRNGSCRIVIMAAVLALATICVMLLKYKTSSGNLEALKQSYLDAMKEIGYPSDMTTDDIFIDEYCGNYKGSIVVMFFDSQTLYTTAIQTETVAGVKFLYRNSNRLVVWKDGAFYTLGEAFARGFLTRSNIILIKYIHLLF